ncbi:MAG: hypothetical protein HKO89_02225 [Saprospiraceae bacterium]|nr:hypothetical protein [Saprospiraceae bacterium]
MKEAEKLMVIENEMKKFRTILSKASDTILEKDVSNYPIFVIHKQEIALGIPIIERTVSNTNWSINASSLEEFVTKQLIFEKKMDEFKKSYKNPETHLCLFVLSDLGAQFIYLPRQG